MAEYMYGIREDGHIVSINELRDIEVGLKCKCECPQCHRKLEACALGERSKVNRYFRHYNEGYNREGIADLNGCTATSANESGLHLMAKELIAENRQIMLPAMEIDLTRLNLQYDEDILSCLPQNIPLRSAFVLDYSEAGELEKLYPGFRPDVSITGNGNTFLIEIAVTHKVGVDKQKKVEEYGLPMLEIDLRDYVEVGITRENLRKILFEETTHKKWISFPKDLINGALQNITAQAEGIKKRKEEEENLRIELEKKRAACFAPDNYASTLRGNRNDYKFERYAKRFRFEAERNSHPFFIDIPITGENLFECDRRIWQGQIFDRWVHNRRPDSNYINMLKVWDGLKYDHKLSYNPLLDGKFLYPDVDRPTFLPYAVIRQYLGYLEQLGFISIAGNGATVLEKHRITPPNQKFASFLQTAMRQIDGFSLLSTFFLDKKVEELQKAEEERLAAIQKKENEARIKREEAARKEKEAAAEQQRKDEAVKKAAEDALRQEDEKIRQEMQHENYEQNDYIVYDRKGRRWTKCMFCKKAVLFDTEITTYDTKAKNKCRCDACGFRG